MTNWSGFNTLDGPRVTTWKYDAYRGWLTNKLYAGSNGPSYTYTPAGRLTSRTWARGITNAYAYNAAGSLSSVVYSDGTTPNVTYTYDRLGRQRTASWNGITDTLSNNLANELLSESFSGGSLAGLAITNGYDQFLRRTALAALQSNNPLVQQSFGYDAASRLQTVNDGNGDSATYSYVANSPLVGQITFKSNSVTQMTTTKQYDYLNRLTTISSSPSSSSSLSFNYTYNNANQRTKNTLADGSYWIYQYDALGQVTGGVKYFADGMLVPGQEFGYLFDDIGNRKQTTAGGDSVGSSLRLANYSVNNLNQIAQRDYPGTNDVIGAALATNSVAVNGQTAWRKGEYFWATVKSNNTAAAQWEGVSVASGGNTNSGNLFVPKTPELFSYDPDGNLTNDGHWAYTWDAENRLIAMTNNTGVGPKYGLAFAYDYQGRRIQKMVSTNGIGIYTNRFLYDGWNLIAELNPASSLVRSYVWGTDLSGSQQGAGGVGGLLEASYYGTQTTNCFPAFDGNGNVMAYINAADGTVVAQLDYDPFLNVIRATGPMANVLPFLGSTKYYDWETKLYYYGHRYLRDGVWPNRDLLGDLAFLQEQSKGKTWQVQKHLIGEASLPSYLFVKNNPESEVDFLGLAYTKYFWQPTPCGSDMIDGFIQVGLGGSLFYSTPFVDDGSKHGANPPNCPPLYPGSYKNTYVDEPNWIGTTIGLNGLKFEVCHVCLKPCTCYHAYHSHDRGMIIGENPGVSIVKIGPCKTYTLPGNGGTEDLNTPGMATSSDSPSAAFNQAVNSSYPNRLSGGCIRCKNPYN